MNHLLRTLPPRLVEQLAIEHDNRIWETFCNIFTIPDADTFDANLNRVPYTCCRRQAKLPMRYGGLGLRDSLRVSPAAYWASWGDSLPILMRRFPAIGAQMVAQLMQVAADMDAAGAALCLCEAELAGRRCELAGWPDRPAWLDLAAGTRPPKGA